MRFTMRWSFQVPPILPGGTQGVALPVLRHPESVQSAPVTTRTLTIALSATLSAVIAAEALAGLLEGSTITIPSFLWCLLVGLVLRNGLAAVGLRLPDAPAELAGSFCLSLFLVWTMMTLDLASIVSLAGPLLIILAGQAILVVVWARWVVFGLAGDDFEAAVSAGAFCDFAMVPPRRRSRTCRRRPDATVRRPSSSCRSSVRSSST